MERFSFFKNKTLQEALYYRMKGDIKKAKAKLKQAALVEEDGQALYALGEARRDGGFGFKMNILKAKTAFNLSALAECPWGMAGHLFWLKEETPEFKYWTKKLHQSGDVFGITLNQLLSGVYDDDIFQLFKVLFDQGNVFAFRDSMSRLSDVEPGYVTKLDELGCVTLYNSYSKGVDQKHYFSSYDFANKNDLADLSRRIKCSLLVKERELVFLMAKSSNLFKLIDLYRIGRAFSWDVDFYHACQIRASKLGVHVIEKVEYSLFVYHNLWSRIRRVCLTLLLGKVWGKDVTRVIAKLVWDGRKRDIKKGIWEI